MPRRSRPAEVARRRADRPRVAPKPSPNPWVAPRPGETPLLMETMAQGALISPAGYVVQFSARLWDGHHRRSVSLSPQDAYGLGLELIRLATPALPAERQAEGLRRAITAA